MRFWVGREVNDPEGLREFLVLVRTVAVGIASGLGTGGSRRWFGCLRYVARHPLHMHCMCAPLSTDLGRECRVLGRAFQGSPPPFFLSCLSLVTSLPSSLLGLTSDCVRRGW